MTNLPQQPILLGQLNLKFRAPKRPHSNKSTTPTLNPLRVDRDPALRGAGLFAVALGALGLGAVTPRSLCIVRWQHSGVGDPLRRSPNKITPE